MLLQLCHVFYHYRFFIIVLCHFSQGKGLNSSMFQGVRLSQGRFYDLNITTTLPYAHPCKFQKSFG